MVIRPDMYTSVIATESYILINFVAITLLQLTFD